MEWPHCSRPLNNDTNPFRLSCPRTKCNCHTYQVEKRQLLPDETNKNIYLQRSILKLNDCNWASEASPTLGCSIEISRDIHIIYVHVSVICQINCVGGITWIKHAHAQSQYWAVKFDQ